MKKLYALLLATSFAAVANGQTYCTPVCSNPSGGCTYGPVTGISIPGSSGTLVDTLGCTGSGYEDHHTLTTMTCSFAPGGTYSAAFTGSSPSPKNCQMWIDFDNDGTFASSESIGGANSWGYTASITLTIPSGVSAGSFRMRLCEEYAGSVHYPSMNPCMGASSYMFADARDYTISIASSSSGCSGTPSGGSATATTTYSCGSNVKTLTDAGASTGSGITYQWEESSDGGTTWTSIAGATGTTCSFPEPTVNMLYRLVVTCAGSSTTSYSSTASISMDRIAGHITYSSAAPDTTSLKVWLIYHNTSAGTLTAIDSVVTCLDSLTPYYEFNGMGAGNYLVKAKSLDVTSSIPGVSGFIPTYGTSNYTWSSAITVNHSGPYNTQNISMLWGVVPTGPGFIGGLISSGAGKGTIGDIPAVNMLVYLQNTATNVLTQTYTDATGAYSFNNIANGSYIIYPEKLGDTTTHSAIQTLTTANEHITGVNFKEHTNLHTITPITSTGLNNVTQNMHYVMTTPNPASNALAINWYLDASETAEVAILDITGREIMHNTILMNEQYGSANIDCSAFANGVYFIRIKSASINYSAKQMIQH